MTENPFEKLEEYVQYCTDMNCTRTLHVIASTLKKSNVRVAMISVGEPVGPYPQLELTVNTDDLSTATLSQLISGLLRKAGIPDVIVDGFVTLVTKSPRKPPVEKNNVG